MVGDVSNISSLLLETFRARLKSSLKGALVAHLFTSLPVLLISLAYVYLTLHCVAFDYGNH